MKLIDVDNFLKQYSDQVCGDTIDAIDLRLALLREPIVDAIPVVRCKDCKYYKPGLLIECEKAHNTMQGFDWFCADGERKG